MQQQQDAEQVMGAPPRLQRVKRLDPPNKAALNEQIGELQVQIKSFAQRIAEIKAVLDNRTQNRHVASPEHTAARSKLAELNNAFHAVVQRKRVRKEELDFMRQKLRGSSGTLPEVKVEELDDQIRKLEFKQTHTTLPIEEEKRLLSQIERLQKSRESLRRHDSRMEQDQGSRAELLDLIKEDEQELSRLKAAQEEQRLILTEIRSKEAALALDIPALLDEKTSSYEKIKGLRQEIDQLKVNFSVKADEYWKREREWRAQQLLERKSREEKGKADWLEREKVRKQRAMENFVEPYTDEIILCDQLISYMQKSAPPDEETATPQQQQKAQIISPEGFGVAIVSKKNRNEDDLGGWFAGSSGKKGKKSKAAAPSRSKVREKISLSFDALSSFETVRISPPTTHGDVLKSLDELKKKKDQFLEMQQKAREARESGVNGASSVVDGEENETSLTFGEGLSTSDTSSQKVENNSGTEHDAASEAFSDDNVLHSDALSSVEVESTVEKDDEEDSKSVHDSLDLKEIVPLDDKAHMESFEFSEASDANLHLEDVVALQEQTVETEIPAGVSKCGLQNGTYEKAALETSKLEEEIVVVAENVVFSPFADCGLDDVPAAINVVHGKVEEIASLGSESENVAMDVLKAESHLRENAVDVLGRVAGLQLEENEVQNGTPLKEVEGFVKL